MIIININNYTDFYSNNNILETRKLRIDKLIQRDNSLIFEQNTIKFRCEEELLVIIRNVKTKEEFICDYLIKANNLVIILDSLLHLFSNYEGAIQILNKSDEKYYLYNPIMKNNNIINEKIANNKQYKWFIRVLENGEIRLSSIINK
ncbi:hypothetical protein H8S10_15385 [Clostridium sp. NSJ-49]|uniref:Uncharacterized protein n=1 Tax=Clostridium disporicum TaxID=84024 RepID=A0A173Y8G6_9CLOT|nr:MULTISPECIES: hypothetical protein [Clostridium]MBC5626824.1 hypothetical protein [Clostridium sp. NSJ-49]MCD2500964.1 hypothetical protein [Clostridium sp. NSJ-145]MDU6339699.1 hypothetical protein [Clostridium sp.]CUN59860.1 Uncharacterised protein [Clostridium disporicum]